MTTVQMTPAQAGPALDTLISSGLPVILWGDPGVGKSALVFQSRERLGYEMTHINASLFEGQPVSGLPILKDGTTHFSRHGWLPAADDTAKRIFFIDELTRASQMTQNGLLGVYDAVPHLAGHLLPKGLVPVSAANYARSTGANRPVDALVNRACHIEIVPDLASWTAWAWAEGIDPTIIAFLTFDSSELMPVIETREMAYPTPRSWARLSKLFTSTTGTIPLERELAGSIIGPAAAAKLMAFKSVRAPNPDAVILNPESAEIPEDPQALVTLSIALAKRANDRNFAKIVTYLNRLADPEQCPVADIAGLEWGTLAIKHALKRDAALRHDPAYCRWVVEHADSMGG